MVCRLQHWFVPARLPVIVCSPLRRVWKVEGCGLDGFEGQVDTGDLVFGAAEGPEDEQVLLGFGEDDPLAAGAFTREPTA